MNISIKFRFTQKARQEKRKAPKSYTHGAILTLKYLLQVC